MLTPSRGLVTPGQAWKVDQLFPVSLTILTEFELIRPADVLYTCWT